MDAVVELQRTNNGEGQGAAAVATSFVAQEAVEPMSKLSIKGHGLSFERDIPDSMVLRIMRLALTREGAADEPTAPLAQGRDAGNGESRKESLAEFYKRAGPKKYPEKLATIAAYMQKILGRNSFTSDDLRGQFRAVNEPAPANMPRDFKTAVGEGWIAEEHDQPGQYFITTSGMETVETGFSAVGGRKASKPRHRKRSAKATTELAAEGE